MGNCRALRRAQIRSFLLLVGLVFLLLMLPGELIQAAAAGLAAWLGLPAAGGQDRLLSLDGLAHLMFFTLLAVAGFRPWRHGYRLPLAGFLVLLAALTEYLQIFVPERSASLSDFGMDLAGVGIGLTGCLLWHRWRRRAVQRPLSLASRV